MTDDFESSLSPAQDSGGADLSETIAAALAEHEGSDDTSDSLDTPETEGDDGETEAPGDDADLAGQTNEADPPPAAAPEEADTGPEGDTEAPDAYRQVAEAYQGVTAPYRAHLASKGVSAPQAVQILLAAEHQLSTGTPDQKARMMAKLAKDYGVEVDAMYDLEDREPVNPEIAQIEQRQAALERVVNGERRQAAAQLHQEIATDVKAFAGEKDGAGNLLRPHFSEVRSTMGQMIEQDSNLTLAQAYDNAVWGNPKLRGPVLAKHRAETAGKVAKAKANKPRRAAKPTSLRDDLQRVYQRATAEAET